MSVRARPAGRALLCGAPARRGGRLEGEGYEKVLSAAANAVFDIDAHRRDAPVHGRVEQRGHGHRLSCDVALVRSDGRHAEKIAVAAAICAEPAALTCRCRANPSPLSGGASREPAAGAFAGKTAQRAARAAAGGASRLAADGGDGPSARGRGFKPRQSGATAVRTDRICIF